MGRTDHQKDLLAAYKERRVVGGVCRVTCGGNKKCLLLGAMELKSQRSRFELAVATDAPLLPAMGPDWRMYGKDSFAFEVLEELERRSDQSDKEFRADITVLADIWREKLSADGASFYV